MCHCMPGEYLRQLMSLVCFDKTATNGILHDLLNNPCNTSCCFYTPGC